MATIYDIVHLVDPDAERVTSYRAGRWYCTVFCDRAEAERVADLWNRKRLCDEVHRYAVEEHDEESPDRAPVNECPPVTVRLPVVCWSIGEREVCLKVAGRERWFPVDRTAGPFDDPSCEVDGARFTVGATHAVHWASWGTVSTAVA